MASTSSSSAARVASAAAAWKRARSTSAEARRHLRLGGLVGGLQLDQARRGAAAAADPAGREDVTVAGHRRHPRVREHEVAAPLAASATRATRSSTWSTAGRTDGGAVDDVAGPAAALPQRRPRRGVDGGGGLGHEHADLSGVLGAQRVEGGGRGGERLRRRAPRRPGPSAAATAFSRPDSTVTSDATEPMTWWASSAAARRLAAPSLRLRLSPSASTRAAAVVRARSATDSASFHRASSASAVSRRLRPARMPCRAPARPPRRRRRRPRGGRTRCSASLARSWACAAVERSRPISASRASIRDALAPTEPASLARPSRRSAAIRAARARRVVSSVCARSASVRASTASSRAAVARATSATRVCSCSRAWAAWRRSCSGSRGAPCPPVSASSSLSRRTRSVGERVGGGQPLDEPPGRDVVVLRAGQRPAWACSAAPSRAASRCERSPIAASTSVRRWMSADSSATSCSRVEVELDEVVGEQPQSGVARVGLDDGGPARRLGLAAERPELTPDLAGEVLDPGEVGLHRLELAQRALLALAVLEDAGGLLDEAAALLRRGPQHGVELALADDDVHLAADAAVGEQLLHVEQPARGAVDRVVRAAVAEHGPGDRDLGVVDRQRTVGVVDRQGDLGAAQGRAAGRAGEDDVLHLAAAQRLRALLPHHPGERVDDVGLAGAVGARRCR